MTIPTFPDLAGITWPVTVTPVWSTARQRSISGRSTALQLWQSPLRRYSLAYDLLRSDVAHAEYQTLLGFYNKLGGPAGLFKFHDIDDCTAAAQAFGAGDGVTKDFHLVSASGGFVYPVQCIVGTPVITVAGAATTAFTLGNTGIVSFTTAPANGAALAWTGAYDWYCQFDEDTLDFDKFAQDFWELRVIKLTTVKL